jgi:RNA polymerase sigma-70 factor (family 1)
MGEIQSAVPKSPLSMNQEDAFGHIFRLLHAPLCFYVRKITGSEAEAEDLVEEVFLQCWIRGQVFEDTQHARFFLYRAVHNAALNRIKAKNRADQKHQMAITLQEMSEESHLERIIQTELIGEIYREIDSLPTQQRKVMLLSLREEKKMQDIADELNLSLQTVKNCKVRAMARLRLQLGNQSWLLILTLLQSLWSR